MRTLFLILFFASFLHMLYPQGTRIRMPLPKDRNHTETEAIDSGSLRIYYAFNAEDINDRKTYADLQRLDIGSKLSKFYSYFLYNNDSLYFEIAKTNKTGAASAWPGERGKMETKWTLLNWSVFFKDFSKNTLTEFANMPYGVPHNQYTEEIQTQEWELQDDTVSIAGYLCQKAVCRFRGRDYVAWFTPEIPVSNGPWKFGGLPGLILNVYDKDNLYVFECIIIESHEKKFPIFMFDDKKYTKTDRVKLRQLDKSLYENYYQVVGAYNLDGSPVVFKPNPYHPLELE